MSGKVVHVSSGMFYDEYIGRAAPGRGLKKSMWANPFKVEEHGRESALYMYEFLIRGWLAEPAADAATRKEVLGRLRNKTLGCWCAPKDRALTTEDETVCHGQVLLRLAEEVS